MSDVAILIVGLVILAIVISDRRGIREAWRHPARFWSSDAREGFRARESSQPGNLVAGIIVGLAAVIYGLVSLLG